MVDGKAHMLHTVCKMANITITTVRASFLPIEMALAFMVKVAEGCTTKWTFVVLMLCRDRTTVWP